MEPSEHIPQVTLFYYLLNVMPLTRDEREHLTICSLCQSVLEDFEPDVRRQSMSPAA
ncbi:MAG TPA: hypothetical protein VKY31_03835 [Terriglobia bacterium]|nr:hypothetical protein [Terriglobia bacterium]